MKAYAIFFFLFLHAVGWSQQTIAKLKYEQAEEAYANSDYKLSLQKILEVEELLKSSNPKTLHLKILSRHKMLDYEPELILPLRKDLEEYLSKYESVSSLEDKFKEIYLIYEAVKDLPASESWIAEQKKDRADEAAALEAFKAKYGSAVLFGEKVCSGLSFQFGITLDQLKKVPAYSNKTFTFVNTLNMYGKTITSYSVGSGEGSYSVSVDQKGFVAELGKAMAGDYNGGDTPLQKFKDISELLRETVATELLQSSDNNQIKELILKVPAYAGSPEYYVRYLYMKNKKNSKLQVYVSNYKGDLAFK